jgi:hypothetical protein
MAAWKPHLRQAFNFSPSAATKLLLKAHNIPDAAPDGHGFNFLYSLNYLKIHLKFHQEIQFLAAVVGTSLSSARQAAYDNASRISSRSKLRIIRQHFVNRFAGGDQSHNRPYRHPHSPNAGLPAHDLGVKCNACQVLHTHLNFIPKSL